MDKALNELLDAIREDYVNWSPKTGDPTKDRIREDMNEAFCNGLEISKGRKYIKIITNNGGGGRSVWGFVVAQDTGKFRAGDILKAASWSSPATNHARGNILDGGYTIQWTGPLYM